MPVKAVMGLAVAIGGWMLVADVQSAVATFPNNSMGHSLARILEDLLLLVMAGAWLRWHGSAGQVWRKDKG
jgi:hypothetical protein